MATTSFNELKSTIDSIYGEEKKVTLKLLMDYIGEVLDLSPVDMDAFRKSRFSHGNDCPHCQQTSIIKFGKKNGQQRYKCRNCNKTFMDCTHSIFSNTKLSLEKWLRYIECMVAGYSIRKCSEIVDVCVKTSFYMRHRVLDAIRTYLGIGHLDGIVEMDETYFAESFKGGHQKSGFILPRESRKRGGEVSKRGISSEQVCVATGIDRSGNMIIEMLCNGRMTTSDLIRLYGGNIDEGAILCTDSHKSYIGLASSLSLEHKQIPRGKHKVGEYHIQHINSLHSRLKDFTDKFRGISTKYLGNYLYWFKWFEYFKTQKEAKKGESMLIHSATSDIQMTLADYQTRKALFV